MTKLRSDRELIASNEAVQSDCSNPLFRAVTTLAVVLVASFGLASTATAFWPFPQAPTKKVATAQVARDFYRARFEDSCHAVPDPAWCHGYAAILNKTDRDIVEANAALDLWHQAKAAMPLQLNALKVDVAAMKAGFQP